MSSSTVLMMEVGKLRKMGVEGLLTIRYPLTKVRHDLNQLDHPLFETNQRQFKIGKRYVG